VAELLTLATVLYLHAMVWLWVRPCVVDPWRSAVRGGCICSKGRRDCVVWHGPETWDLPHGELAVKLGLLDKTTGDPQLNELRKGWV
jgi:hypothetical protein